MKIILKLIRSWFVSNKTKTRRESKRLYMMYWRAVRSGRAEWIR